MKKILLLITVMLCFITHTFALDSNALITKKSIENVYYNYKEKGVIKSGEMYIYYINDEPAYRFNFDDIEDKSICYATDKVSDVPLHVKNSSYFGFSHYDNNEIEDYLATQYLIWDFQGYDVFYTTQYGGNGEIIDISKYISKIEYMVTSYGWFPNFDTNYIFEVGKIYDLYDKNTLMSDEFVIHNDTKNSFDHISNGIRIKNYYSGKYHVNLERVYKDFGDNKLCNNLIHIGNIPSLNRDYFYEVKGANLFITIKSDRKDLNFSNDIFELYDENNNLVGTYDIINGKIEITNLDIGRYMLMHTNSDYYITRNEIIYLDGYDNYKEIVLTPKEQFVNIDIKGIDKITGKENSLAGETITIYDSKNNKIITSVSDEYGLFTTSLVVDKYIVKVRDKEYIINIEDFKNDIDISFIFEVFNASLKLNFIDDKDNDINIEIMFDNNLYNTLNNECIIDNIDENTHELIIDNELYEFEKIDILINSNSVFNVKNQKVYVEYIIKLKTINKDNETKEESIIDELPNLGV